MNHATKGKLQSLFSDTAIFAVGNILSKLVVFVLLPLYTSTMTAQEYGTAELINNASELIYPVFCLCIYEAAFRFALDATSNKKSVFTSAFLLTLCMVPVACLMTAAINAFSRYEYAWYLSVLVCVMSVRILCAQFAKGLGMIKPFALSGVITSLVLFGLNIILLMTLKMGIKGYLSSMIAANVITTAYLFFRCGLWKYLGTGFDGELFRQMLLYSLPMVPNIMAWWFNNISGRYVVLYFYGAGVAGLFTAASKLPSVINMFSSVFQQAWQISTAREIETREGAAFFSKVYQIYSGLILIGSASLIAIMPWLSKLMLKNEFYEARLFVPFLVLGAVLNCYNVFFGTFYTAIKKNRMIMVSTMIGTGVNLVVTVVLTPLIGVWGAIAGNAVGFLIIVAMRVVDTRRFIRVEMDWRINVPAMFIVLAQAIVSTIDFRGGEAVTFGLLAILIASEMWYYRDALKNLLRMASARLCRS